MTAKEWLYKQCERTIFKDQQDARIMRNLEKKSFILTFDIWDDILTKEEWEEAWDENGRYRGFRNTNP